MTTITAPGPLLPLDAPLPQPRIATLLDAATAVPEQDERWRAGARVNGYPAGRPNTHDPCSTGTFRAKDAENTGARPAFGSFTVVVGGVCTSVSIGSDPAWYTERLRRWFEAVESEAVERVLATGDGHSSLGSYLGDANMETLGSAAVSPTEGLALLEDAIAAYGNGMIHVAPATATYWQCAGCITVRNNIARTGLGTIVAVGAGYRGAVPDGEEALGAGEEWAFASGFVQYRRGEVQVLGDTYAQSLDRTSNQATFYAERDYLLTFVGRQSPTDDNHVQAGVLIDRLSS